MIDLAEFTRLLGATESAHLMDVEVYERACLELGWFVSDHAADFLAALRDGASHDANFGGSATPPLRAESTAAVAALRGDCAWAGTAKGCGREGGTPRE